MKNDKKTGLGSLLLQVTEPDASGRPLEDPAASNVPDGEPETGIPATQAAQQAETPRSPGRRRAGKVFRTIPRDKCTIHIDQDVNEQLTLVAGVEGRDRSEIVTQILRKHLPKYRVERQ